MRPRARVVALALAVIGSLSPGLALAGPGDDSQVKEQVSPTTSPDMTRDEIIGALVEAEALLTTDQVADAIAAMIVIYFLLETTDGAEAAGVTGLRSWLVKALETLDLPEEAAALRQRGSYSDQPLSILPSTWFRAAAPIASNNTMTVDQAATAVEQGLTLLTQGNVDGLAMLLDAYLVIEAQQGAESQDAIVLRSFLVGLLETGGFTDEAASLRQRGSVTPATAEDTQAYVNTWATIIAASEAAPVFNTNVDTSAIKAPLGTGAATTTTTEPVEEPVEPYVEPEPEREKVIEPGSPVPSVGIDIGAGSFLPTLGTKGFIWLAGLDLRWTLFRAKFFGLTLGGGGQVGRNRDKRWWTDVGGSVGFSFDFQKVYIIPEFGGGYDGVAGGDKPLSQALRWKNAPYYDFGGTLGVRIGDKLGLYGRALRFNRGDDIYANETRVRGGLLFYLDKATIDLAFVFTDYDSKGKDPVTGEDNPSAQLFGGLLGFQF